MLRALPLLVLLAPLAASCLAPVHDVGELEGLTFDQAAERLGISAEDEVKMTNCQYECVIFSTAGCGAMHSKCDGLPGDSAAPGPDIGPYECTCDAAIRLACGGIYESGQCMRNCDSWWERVLNALP